MGRRPGRADFEEAVMNVKTWRELPAAFQNFASFRAMILELERHGVIFPHHSTDDSAVCVLTQTGQALLAERP
jgi:hypothetical protein